MTEPHTIDLQAYATQIRRVLASDGQGLLFHTEDRDQNLPAALANIHSRISQVLGMTPARETVQGLGQVIVACLDLCELLEPGGLARMKAEGDWAVEMIVTPIDVRYVTWAEGVLMLHSGVSSALWVSRHDPRDIQGSRVIEALVGVMRETWRLVLSLAPGTDFQTVMAEIMEARPTSWRVSQSG